MESNELVPWRFHPKLKVKGPEMDAQWTVLGSPGASLLGFGGRTSVHGEMTGQAHLHLAQIVLIIVVIIGNILVLFVRRRRRTQYEVVGPAIVV